ncbi:Protein root UVB sensitive 6 [Dichanthelium oligosanthes]|uniref:Protein root UVB sensitive 6 n=1 Tax=Dichanthelium oligosanthes TaxID=888268 RepID=A0A1E5WCU9_9POAL|nr:Protein root UVB sensitive 6 [Dichanthelium oligosanthes]
MAPAVGVKRPATQTTITLPPPAVRDVLRSTIPTSQPAEAPAAAERAAPAAAVEGFLCLEEVDGRRWSYVVDGGGAVKGSGRGRAAGPAGASVRAVPLQSPLPPAEEIMAFIRSYVVPEGFPDSVTPSYVPYMSWRALKHFFGGAMGVFTTRTLLSSVGVSQSKVTPGAIAINWILKDGAGRVGKMLFARQGKKFDYDLKQLRFSSDLLLEIGAGIELTTAAFPQFFLPMACVANVVKNVAAVTSTSTRTPIYKAYARGENIGDVTAKGESVGNIADLLGTGLSIFISKRNPSLVTSFAFLSCGYLLSSYQEVRSVVLNTLNRARFTVAVDSFIKTGHIPSLKEGNSQETIFNPPWRHEPVAIGSRFGEAFQEPASFVAIRPLFEDERYIVTYNPTKDKVYALLKDQAKSDDIIKAAFHAHVLLHFINASHARRLKQKQKQKQANPDRSDYGNLYSRNMDFLAHIAESCKIVSSSYGTFKKKAREQGWIMSESLLNPGKARLCGAKPL